MGGVSMTYDIQAERSKAAKAIERATAARKILEQGSAINSAESKPTWGVSHAAPSNPFGRLFNMNVSQEMVSKIADAKFAWLQLIPQGQSIAICAKPNGGKTTIFTQAAADMARDRYQVIYINADASASDIKDYSHHANDYGYMLLNPDISGHSNEQVVCELKAMASLDADYSNTILILDTLKKFTDMMAKSKGKAFYSIIRSLTSKGMTVIALAHTNKYDGEDGLPVYEGTADLRADFDDLIYLIPVKNPDGSMTVSTHIDKSRAALIETTFLIDSNRKVTVLDSHVDTLALSKHKKHLEADSEAIEFILGHIKNISKTANELFKISQDADCGFTRRYLRGVLGRYASGICPDPLWLTMAGITNGTRYGQISPEYKSELSKKWTGV
jgi:hypothetical protein